jgi:adenylosuccinate synthase
MSVKSLVLLSGPLAVGKTAIRSALVDNHGFSYLRSSEYLRGVAKSRGIAIDRLGLQTLGDDLDKATDYRWLITDVAQPAMSEVLAQELWVVDAVRKHRQVEHFRDAFGHAVHHVHLTAPEEVLRARYYYRQAEQGNRADLTSYETAVDHDNERASRALIKCADVVIDVVDRTPAEVVQMILQGVTETK